MTKPESTIKINTDNLDEVAPLYCQYDGQHNPQPAYVEIDPRGDEISVSADVDHIIGSGCGGEVFHNLVYLVPCPHGVLGPALSEHMESAEFKNLVIDLCVDYEEYWDGNNYRGRWDDLAEVTAQAIEASLHELPVAEIYDGDDWIAESVSSYGEDGEPCTLGEAARAYWGNDDTRIEITRENIDKLVKDAEEWVDSMTVVNDLDGAFERVVDTLESNRD